MQNELLTVNTRYKLVRVSEIISRLNIPSFQRLINEEHVDSIYQGIKEEIENKTYVFPGTIIICETDRKISYIVDGLHRITAFTRIYKNLKIDAQICINIISVKDEEHAYRVFRNVNNTMRVYEMPAGISIVIPNQIVAYFKGKFPKFFKPSMNCKRPHLNETVFTEAMGKILEKHSELSATDIITTLENYNKTLAVLSPEDFWKKGKLSSVEAALKSAREKGGLFFGVFEDYQWLYELFDIEEKDEIREEKTAKKRENIPKYIKTQIWNKYVGNRFQVKCPVCKTNAISAHNFHAGHIISDKNGGKTDIENLRPVCASCNQSYGSENMNVEFLYENF